MGDWRCKFSPGGCLCPAENMPCASMNDNDRLVSAMSWQTLKNKHGHVQKGFTRQTWKQHNQLIITDRKEWLTMHAFKSRIGRAEQDKAEHLP
eukprot:scaffold238364_cov25-Prasinocladus_malaysianus.AAC.1